jgi:hypothetical protein
MLLVSYFSSQHIVGFFPLIFSKDWYDPYKIKIKGQFYERKKTG